MPYHLLANLVLILHALFIAFAVLGQVAILVGAACSWRWVRDLWFRVVHLLAIGAVVAMTWLHVTCPLTVWENALRVRAGESLYPADCIGYWLHRLLFFDAPGWVFTLAYTLFGLTVVGAFVLAPPRRG